MRARSIGVLSNVANARRLFDAILDYPVETLHRLCGSIAAQEARDDSAF